MHKLNCLFLFLTLCSSSFTYSAERPYLNAKIGGGIIEGSSNDGASDLQLATEITFMFPIIDHLDIEIGAIGTGTIPIFSDLFDTDTADYTNYFAGLRPHYRVASWLDTFIGVGIGYGKVTEYAPTKNAGTTTFSQSNEFSGITYYATAGITIQPFTHLGFTASARYDKLPQSFSGINILFGLDVYF